MKRIENYIQAQSVLTIYLDVLRVKKEANRKAAFEKLEYSFDEGLEWQYAVLDAVYSAIKRDYRKIPAVKRKIEGVDVVRECFCRMNHVDRYNKMLVGELLALPTLNLTD